MPVGSGPLPASSSARGVLLGLGHVRLVERVDAEQPARRSRWRTPRRGTGRRAGRSPTCRQARGPPGSVSRSTTSSSSGPGVTGGVGARPPPAGCPVPCLPVDSAMSCSIQSAQAGDAGGVSGSTQLVPPGERAAPSAAPSCSAGVALVSSASAAATAAASSSSAPRRRRRARSAPGRTRSARCSGRRRSGRRARSGSRPPRRAASSGEPGSVTTMIRSAGSMPASRERLLVDAAVAVGLDRAAALARDHHDRAVEAGRRAPGAPGRVGGVEHGERDVGGRGDHLGGERRAAHPGEHDVVEAALAQLGGAARRPRQQLPAGVRRG